MRMYGTAYRRVVSSPTVGDMMGFFDTSGKHLGISSAEHVVWFSFLETLAILFPHAKHDAPQTSILRRALPCSRHRHRSGYP